MKILSFHSRHDFYKFFIISDSSQKNISPQKPQKACDDKIHSNRSSLASEVTVTFYHPEKSSYTTEKKNRNTCSFFSRQKISFLMLFITSLCSSWGRCISLSSIFVLHNALTLFLPFFTALAFIFCMMKKKIYKILSFSSHRASFSDHNGKRFISRRSRVFFERHVDDYDKDMQYVSNEKYFS